MKAFFTRLVVAAGIPLILIALIGTAFRDNGVADSTILFEGDSIYNHITIREAGGVRCMLFGRLRDNRETCIRIDAPDVSIFEYTAMMFTGFFFARKPERVLLIGLGGGYIPLVFKTHLHHVMLDVVEVDPLVAKLAGRYFDFSPSGNVTLDIRDGRQFLKKSHDSYDHIWIDAFNSDYIPSHMTTREFLLLTKTRLNEGGIVVQNVHNDNRLFDAQVATFRSVFRHVFLFKGKLSSNTIIVAADDPLYKPQDFRRQAGRFVGKIGAIDLAEQLAKYDPDPEIRTAPVLTDDYSPANLWIHKKRGVPR
ncbi:MAG: fused MFS/spermidine synthase [Deltaproteobacteria bacterium]|nr:fused MFS/spermidine synthase [Deltaproteobacteria bacterium]